MKLFIYFFYFGLTASCQDYFSHFEPSTSPEVERKRDEPREKPPDHPHAELGLSHLWPELGSNPQRWDDDRFRTLTISVLTTRPRGVKMSDKYIIPLMLYFSVSCAVVSIGTIYNDPCVECSNTFFACSGEDTPIELTCPGTQVWSPATNMCNENCDA